MKRILIILFFLTEVCIAQQKAVFSQYMFHGLVLNPAYAASDEALNVSAIHRNQWLNIKGSPEMQNLYAHKYIKDKNIGLGAMFEREVFGVTKSYNLNLAYAYKLRMQGNKSLSFGIKGGVSSYRQELTDLILPQSGVFDPSFDHNVQRTLFNAGFGTYYESESFYAGISVPNFLTSKLDDNTVLQARQVRHLFVALGYLYEVNPSVKLKPQALVKYVSGAPIGVDFSFAALMKEVLWVGATFKHNNSVNGFIEIKASDELKIGFAYDIISSDLDQVTPGTYEISVNYRYMKRTGTRIMSPRYF